MQASSEKIEVEKQASKREVIVEVNSIRKENSQVISRIKQLLENADAEKVTRDKENATVKKITSEIQGLRAQINEIQKNLNEFAKQLSTLQGEFVSPEKIKREIESIEYFLHLNYSQAREKAASRKVKELSKNLIQMQAAAPKIAELQVLRVKLGELRKKLFEEISELKLHSSQSQEHHEKMHQFLKQAEQLQPTLSTSFTELSEKQAVLEQIKYGEDMQKKKQRRELEEHRKELNAQHQVQMEQVKQKAREIMQRFKLGESISFEELQVLQAAEMDISS